MILMQRVIQQLAQNLIGLTEQGYVESRGNGQ